MKTTFLNATIASQTLRNLLKSQEKKQKKGDTRPIYVFNFFERLDEATDIASFVDLLVSLDRQVFVGVGNYPIERFENNGKVQILSCP